MGSNFTLHISIFALRSTGSIPYNRDNQRTGSETYEYDGNGNPFKYKSSTQNMWFDVENRLTQVGTAMYAGYNGNGLRAWKDNDNNPSNGRTYFLYDGTDLLCELNASGTVLATNTWGANGLVSRRVGTTSTFYVFDPQGSVAQRLDSSGNVVSSDLYDAYGAKLAGNPNNDPYGYNGQWGYYTDNETGLTLCTHRYYDPANGRWLTRDPIGYEGGIGQYAYCMGDPLNWADPFGLRKKRKSVVDQLIDQIQTIITSIDREALSPAELKCHDSYAGELEDCVEKYRKCAKKFISRITKFLNDPCHAKAAICIQKARAKYECCLWDANNFID